MEEKRTVLFICRTTQERGSIKGMNSRSIYTYFLLTPIPIPTHPLRPDERPSYHLAHPQQMNATYIKSNHPTLENKHKKHTAKHLDPSP